MIAVLLSDVRALAYRVEELASEHDRGIVVTLTRESRDAKHGART